MHRTTDLRPRERALARRMPAGAEVLVEALPKYMRQFEKFQVSDLDSYFEEAYSWFFIHVDAEDLRNRWATVRPRVSSILKAATSVSRLPEISSWEIRRIDECLEKDVWYLRLLAKLLRGLEANNRPGGVHRPNTTALDFFDAMAYRPGRGLDSEAVLRLKKRKEAERLGLPSEDLSEQANLLLGNGARKVW
eukprot:s280_g13.t1